MLSPSSMAAILSSERGLLGFSAFIMPAILSFTEADAIASPLTRFMELLKKNFSSKMP
jgi:hypothetical protein